MRRCRAARSDRRPAAARTGAGELQRPESRAGGAGACQSESSRGAGRHVPANADRRTRDLVLTRIALANWRLAVGSELNLTAAQRAVDTASARLGDVLKENPNDAEARGLQLDVAVARASLLHGKGSTRIRCAPRVRRSNRALRRRSTRRRWIARRSAPRAAARLLAEGMYYGGDAAAAEQPYREQLALLERLSAQLPQDIGRQSPARARAVGARHHAAPAGAAARSRAVSVASRGDHRAPAVSGAGRSGAHPQPPVSLGTPTRRRWRHWAASVRPCRCCRIGRGAPPALERGAVRLGSGTRLRHHHGGPC